MLFFFRQLLPAGVSAVSKLPFKNWQWFYSKYTCWCWCDLGSKPQDDRTTDRQVTAVLSTRSSILLHLLPLLVRLQRQQFYERNSDHHPPPPTPPQRCFPVPPEGPQGKRTSGALTGVARPNLENLLASPLTLGSKSGTHPVPLNVIFSPHKPYIYLFLLKS